MKHSFLPLGCLLSLLTLWSCETDASKEGAGRDPDAVDFRLKFEPGKTYFTESSISQESTIPLGGKEVESKVEMTALSFQTVTADGDNLKVVQKMEKMDMSMDAGGMGLAYDSENPKGPAAAMMAPLMDATTTLVLSPQGEVVSLDAEVPEGMEALGFGEKELKQSAIELLELMPNKEVSPQGTWTIESSLPLAGITNDPVTIDYTMTFAGMEEKEGRQLAKVAIDGHVDEDDGNLRVTSNKIEGELLFDPEIGQPRHYELLVDITVSLPEGTQVVGGAVGEMPIKMTSVSTLVKID